MEDPVQQYQGWNRHHRLMASDFRYTELLIQPINSVKMTFWFHLLRQLMSNVKGLGPCGGHSRRAEPSPPIDSRLILDPQRGFQINL